MIIQLFNASVLCVIMTNFDSLFGVTLIYGMLNGAMYQVEEVHAHHSRDAIYN
jgi:hypothetical protein